MRSFRASLIGTVVLPLATGLMFCGCSSEQSDTPTEAAAREYYEGKFKDVISPTPLKIVTFKKTNGIKRANESYELEYEAELEFPKGWRPECVGPKAPTLVCMNVQLPLPEGAKKRDTGKVFFEKSEKGWRPRGMQPTWVPL